MNQITLNHDLSETPGQQITHPLTSAITHAPTFKSRNRRFRRSTNHAANHANHANQITQGRVSLKRDPSPLAGGASREGTR